MSIFSCTYWLFVYPLWRNVYSSPLPVFSFCRGFLSRWNKHLGLPSSILTMLYHCYLYPSPDLKLLENKDCLLSLPWCCQEHSKKWIQKLKFCNCMFWKYTLRFNPGILILNSLWYRERWRKKPNSTGPSNNLLISLLFKKYIDICPLLQNIQK